MNVLLLTMDEPIYMPQYLEPILDRYGEEINEVVIAPHPNDSLGKTVRERYEMFGPTAFLRFGLHFGFGKVVGALPHHLQQSLTGRYHSVSALCHAYDIPVRVEAAVNDERFLARVRRIDLDLLLSISCRQKLGSELLGIPTHGAINIHGSLLPKYRGRATAFWVLYHDEEYSGVTAHYMNEEFDDGDIVVQRRFPIADDDTMHDIYNKVVETGAEVASEVIENVVQDELEPVSNPPSEGEYRSLPDAAERREFRRRGNRFR